jgi:hypothetical protein
MSMDAVTRAIGSVNLTDMRPTRRTMRWKIIPSPQEWAAASATSHFQFLDRRGSPEIRAIDAAVAEYNRLALLNGVPTVQLWEAAVDLFEAIEMYLAVPRGHKQPRVDAVRDLRAATMVTLSDLRWKKLKEASGGFKPGMKPMVQHVWSEVHSPGHARVGHGEDPTNDPDAWLREEEGATEKYLFQYLRRVRAENPSPDNVQYIEDSDRWKYQVVFSESGLAYERFSEMGGQVLQTGNPITTKGADLSTCAYAVDEKGVFYTETSHHTGELLNHCSYLAGRPVMCAGNIGITNGIVGYIDNGSGHYRPTVENLLRGLEALQQQSSPLNFDAILVRNHAGPNPMVAYLAGKFLRNRGRCLPAGYFTKTGFGSHYRSSFTEFQNSAEIRAYMEGQDSAEERAKLQKEINQIFGRLEQGRVNNELTGKMTSDADRQILQAALQAGIATREFHERYYVNDAPMMEWQKKQTYGVKIPH